LLPAAAAAAMAANPLTTDKYKRPALNISMKNNKHDVTRTLCIAQLFQINSSLNARDRVAFVGNLTDAPVSENK
jgi:hypothetical protein